MPFNFLKKKKPEQKKEVINFQTGQKENEPFSLLDMTLPSAIDGTVMDYLYMDGTYVKTMLIIDYPYNVGAGWLENIINCEEGVEFSLKYAPLNKTKTIRDITQQQGLTKYKITTGQDKTDEFVQANAYEHSQIIKKALASGDDLWNMSLFIKIYANSRAELYRKVEKVETTLVGMGMMYSRADCRQLEAFGTALPFKEIHNTFKRESRRNILTSGLAGTFPFISFELSDDQGVYVGNNEHNGSAVVLDMFNTTKYSNANMTVLGTSGSGKTFTTQLIAKRLNLQNIPIMMICPLKGHEYKPLCDSIGGRYINFSAGSSDTINILDINPTKTIGSVEKSFLLAKIQRLQVFFSLMFPNISFEEKQMLDEVLMDVYKSKGIKTDNDSLYLAEQANDISLRLKPKLKTMPILADLYNAIKDDSKLEHIANLLKPYIFGSLSFFNGQTNIDLENTYIVADISEVQKEQIPLAMFTVLDIFWDKIRENPAVKKTIILDEAWQLMGAAGNVLTAEYVVEIFKIIRGYGGSAICATQDISDFMALEGGKYGKAIINNAKLKLILQLEEQEAQTLKEVLNLSEEELVKITHFPRGTGLLYAGSNHIGIKFLASEKEKMMITTDRKDLARKQNAQRVV